LYLVSLWQRDLFSTKTLGSVAEEEKREHFERVTAVEIRRIAIVEYSKFDTTE
jgi:hypothetical protein